MNDNDDEEENDEEEEEEEGDEEDPKIKINNVTTMALEKIMDYCKVHVHLLSPRGNRKIDNVAQWDENFVKLEPGTLCELASVKKKKKLFYTFFFLE